MLLALSKFLPRVFHKKSTSSKSNKSVNDEPATGENAKSCTCRVVLLDESELSLDVKLSAKGCVLLDRVFLHLNLVEKEYFGLRYINESGQPLWLDLTKAISSQLLATELPHTFYFGVKFYAVDPCKLHAEITRYQFFLQVKRDVEQGRLPVPIELAAQLAAYAVQSELGDYNPQQHQPQYVSEFSFIPSQTLEFENKVASIHQTLKGQAPSVAEYHYLDKVKWLDMYGVDLHPVVGDGNIDYFLGLTPSGIVVYKNKTKVSNYFWPRVSKITYKHKNFLIRARDRNNEENTYTFECSMKQACKHLYKCCVEYHSFFRLTSASHSFHQSKNRLLSFSSKHRYSGKSSKTDQSSNSNERPDQAILRRPSQRKPHKAISGSESCPEDFSRMPRPMSAVILPQPVNKCYRRDGYSSGPESTRTSKSAPWESQHHHRGMYTGGRESPTSVRSEYFPRRGLTSGSESDSTLCPRRRRHHHHHRTNPSDTETEAESYHRRHRGGAGTESESDVGSHHSRHRHRGRSNEDMNGFESQWRSTQMRIRDVQTTGPFDLQPNGSMSSMVSAPEQRRHRKRSKSPGNRPPDELAQHFRYIDPCEEGLTEDQLKDIPYTRVDTSSEEGLYHGGTTSPPLQVVLTNANAVRLRYSPRTRDRIRHYRRQKSCGELPGGGSQLKLPDGEAPPPYLGPRICSPCYPSSVSSLHTSHSSNHHRQRTECEYLRSPMAVQMTQTHTAPIVKTKVLMRSDELCSDTDRTTNNSAGANLCHQMQRPPNTYDQIMFVKEPRRIAAVDSSSGQQPTTSRALNCHMREDSGLDLDSPAGSSSSQMADTLPGPFPHSSHPHQQHQSRSPARVCHQRSPMAGTPAPASAAETSPYIEQASSDNYNPAQVIGYHDPNEWSDSHTPTRVAQHTSRARNVGYYSDYVAPGTFQRGHTTDL